MDLFGLMLKYNIIQEISGNYLDNGRHEMKGSGNNKSIIQRIII